MEVVKTGMVIEVTVKPLQARQLSNHKQEEFQLTFRLMCLKFFCYKKVRILDICTQTVGRNHGNEIVVTSSRNELCRATGGRDQSCSTSSEQRVAVLHR